RTRQPRRRDRRCARAARGGAGAAGRWGDGAQPLAERRRQADGGRALMKVPVPLKIAVLAVAATSFYTYLGQLVPQKEVQPPDVTKLAATMTPQDRVQVGEKIVQGKGSCLPCHTIGKTSGPYRYPDLAGVGARAQHRVPGFTDVQYFAQTLYHPNDFI